MVKTTKLYERLLTSRGSLRFREFQRVLEAFGFECVRIKGSHHQYVHPLVPRPLSVQPKGNMAKPYQVDMFVDMVEEFGLEMSD